MEKVFTSQSYQNDTSHEYDARIMDYFSLLKPRVMSLVVFTGFAGLYLAPGVGEIHPFLIVIAMLCLAVNAGAAGAINMWYDRDIDAVMKRTRGRPIPMGRVNPDEALAFGVFLSIFSVMMMGTALNWVAAGVLAFANFFYVVIYTMWLKRSTPQNIVIGGAAGAFPPIVGWAAVTGDVSIAAVVLFAIIFFWTPPHFWALSLYANEDYKRAGVPMMTVIAGERKTKIQMLVYALLLFPLTLLPYFFGVSGMLYLGLAIMLSGFFVITSIKVLFSDDMKYARLMFGYSVFYLFALFLGMIIDAT